MDGEGDRKRSLEEEVDYADEDAQNYNGTAGESNNTEATRERRISNENADAKPEVKSPTVKVDRSKTCPMYVRMFCRVNGHHRYFQKVLLKYLPCLVSCRLEEFSRDRQPLDDELIIYTWKDATLKELSDLIKEVHADSRRKEAKFSFMLLYQDLRGDFRSKPLGTVANSRPSKDDLLTLEELRFVQGDFIDVSIQMNPALAMGGGSGMMADRPVFNPVSRLATPLDRMTHRRPSLTNASRRY